MTKKTLILFSFLAGAFLRLNAYSQPVPVDSLREIKRQISILTEEIEKLKLGEVAEPKYEATGRGLGPAASRVYRLRKTGVSIAGYGEVVYENYSDKKDDNIDSGKKDQVDFYRNVLYVGYKFNDWILFNSELEFEHGSTGKGGEVSVEFGYVELMISKRFNFRAGMILSPLGIVNEKHEPSTFFGTLRPQVEQKIIPSTWRANGVGIYGTLLPAVTYRAYVTEGLNVKNFSPSDGIRGGRQNGAKAIAEDFAVAGKVEYEGIAGGILGSSFYFGNSGQGEENDSLGAIKAQTTIFSIHGEYAWKGFEFRALYAQVQVGQTDKVNRLLGKTIGSLMNGWYVVVGYDVIPLFKPGSEHYFAPFVQYEKYNTHAEVATGYSKSKANDRTTLAIGLTYKPHPNIAFKFDFRDNSDAAKTGIDQWNLAVNYLF